MIVFFWILNFVISWFNAWGCGKTWTEAKANGGIPYFMLWCGAIMSASGFTWCYLVILGFFGATIPFEQEINGEIVSQPYLSGDALQAFADLGYTLVVFPILGSGIAITIHSWGVFWRRRNFVDGGISVYNTFAMGHNIYSAVQTLPGAFDRLGDFFGSSSSSSSSSNNKGQTIVPLLVALAAIGGIVTTTAIIRATMKSTARNRQLKYAHLER